MVTKICGLLPRRVATRKLSHAVIPAASGDCLQAATSSPHACVNCGPRNESGSSAVKQVAVFPFGHVKRRFDGSYKGRSDGGVTFIIPDSPSTRTSRTSAAVRATKAKRRCPSFVILACSRTHSAAVRVLPNPRPASSNQIFQSPSGVRCSGRPQKVQSQSKASESNPSRIFPRSTSSSSATICASDLPIRLLSGAEKLHFYCIRAKRKGRISPALLFSRARRGASRGQTLLDKFPNRP